MTRFYVIVATLLVAAGILGCCAGYAYPSEDLSVRWSNAVCESHDGLDEWEEIEVDGEDAGTATAYCADGSAWVQEYNPDDEDSPWESPVEVRSRQEGEP